MLGVTEGRGPLPPDTSAFTDDQTDDFFAGKALLRTCVDTYTSTKTGLAPEVRLPLGRFATLTLTHSTPNRLSTSTRTL